MFARLARQTKAITADNIHDYRTRSKRIRYVAEMAGASPESKRVVGLLKRVQDSIGDWHDWQTLTITAQELFSRSLDSALVSALRNLSNAKFVEARAVALDARRELMRDYRAMLVREREKKQLAVAAPAQLAHPKSVNGSNAATARYQGQPRRKPASPASAEKTTAGVA